PAVSAQCTFPRSSHARRAGGDSRGNVRRVEHRMALALSLSSHDLGMTSIGALLLLQGPTAPGGGSPLFQLGIQFALILAIFYFLMIRPQQKQRRQHEEALRNLKKGDEIVTAGGIGGQGLYTCD